MSRQIFVRIACLSAAFAALVTVASAQTLDKRTFFTFSTPVAVPGATLPAGKYLFRLTDINKKEVVQVLSANGKTPYAQFFALRDQRAKAPDNPEVRFLETAAGRPAAIQTWYYPGDRNGYEFVYPKAQARLLAKSTGQPVLTTAPETASAPETQAAPLARISPRGEEVKVPDTVVAEAPPTPAAAALVGEVAPESIQVPETRVARAQLPKTASLTPTIALTGLLLLLGAAFVRTVRLARH